MMIGVKSSSRKSSNSQKIRTILLLNFFPTISFWFRRNHMCYRDGWSLILKLIPNNEEWYDKTAWFNWNRNRKFSSKCNIKIVKIVFYVKLNKISILDWAVLLGDAYPTHPTLIKFSFIFVEHFPNDEISKDWIKKAQIEKDKTKLGWLYYHTYRLNKQVILKPIWTGVQLK